MNKPLFLFHYTHHYRIFISVSENVCMVFLIFVIFVVFVVFMIFVIFLINIFNRYRIAQKVIEIFVFDE